MQPILLLNAPPGDPTQSYTSVPTLTGHLRRQGFRVEQRDLGIEILDHVLTENFLTNSWKGAVARAALPSDTGGFSNRFRRAKAYHEFVIRNVETAKLIMRDENEFYNLERYNWATNVINLSCDLASLPNHPSRLSPAQYKQDVECTVDGLNRGTKLGQDNFFAQVYDDFLLNDLLNERPILIGISITYHFQVVPALTLARMIKEVAPNIPVVIGGAIVSRMEPHLRVDSKLFQYADYFVVGEGESALAHLASCMKNGDTVSDYPNLIKLKDGKPHTSRTDWIEDIKTTGVPDFMGLPIERYLSPEPVFLLPASRGCYWGKCTFCDVSRQTRSVYRPVHRSAVVNEIKNLNRVFGAKRFFFCDDAVPPGTLRDVATFVREQMPDVTWQAEVRFERPMDDAFIRNLSEGGCRQLMFGYESSSQRILNKMLKNNSHNMDLQIIDSCYDSGIAVNLQTFVGLPTETRAEAQSTVDFIISKEERICSIGFGLFSLWKDTPIYNEPEKHGVTAISIPLEHSLIADCDFETLNGMSRQEASEFCESSKKQLDPIFRARSAFLGGAAGAHSLLFYSKFGFKHFYKICKQVESPINTSIQGAELLSRVATIERYRDSNIEILFDPIRAKCMELTKFEAAIYQATDKPVSLDEILEKTYKTLEICDVSDIANYAKPVKAYQNLLKHGYLEVCPT